MSAKSTDPVKEDIVRGFVTVSELLDVVTAASVDEEVVRGFVTVSKLVDSDLQFEDIDNGGGSKVNRLRKTMNFNQSQMN